MHVDDPEINTKIKSSPKSHKGARSMPIRIARQEKGLLAEFVCDWCEEKIEDAGLGVVAFVMPSWESCFLHGVGCLRSFERNTNRGRERDSGGIKVTGIMRYYRRCGKVFSLDLEGFLMALVRQNTDRLEVRRIEEPDAEDVWTVLAGPD
jgi:hypothetical protein